MYHYVYLGGVETGAQNIWKSMKLIHYAKLLNKCQKLKRNNYIKEMEKIESLFLTFFYTDHIGFETC